MATDTIKGGAVRRFFKAIEPWYDWGIYHIERMEGSTAQGSAFYGTARFFQVQWLGVHLHVQIGRTPKREAE